MLLQRPEPFTDESLESYLIRVANKNGYERPDRFLSALKRFLYDIDSDTFSTFPTDIRRIQPCFSRTNSKSRIKALHQISQLTFTEPANLLALTINRAPLSYSKNTRSLIRGDEVFPSSLLRREQIPCCPTCLKEQGYANYLWSIEGYNVCHKHNHKLVYQCQCGAHYDYREHGLSAICPACNARLDSNDDSTPVTYDLVSHWLAGEKLDLFPDIPASFRWGLIHWWRQIYPDETFNQDTFCEFWLRWPDSFHQLIEKHIFYNQEHSLLPSQLWRIKDTLSDLLYCSICLPSRNLKYNLILNELFCYLEQRLWINKGEIANLRLNAIDAALILNCHPEQIASMVEQGLLAASKRQKKHSPLSYTDYLFYFGDVFCLWIAEFQTDEFNRSFYTSRW